MNYLIRHLVQWFLFGPMMFFAAGAVDISGGGDAGADSGSGGGAGDGEISGGDAPDASRNTGGDEAGDTQVQSGDSTQQGRSDSTALVDDGAGRKIPAKYAELFKTDKALKEAYFSAQAIRSVFPGGIKEAREIAKTLEEIGGVEGIESLKGDLDTYRADQEAFEKDPAKWVESAFLENGESALKAFTHSLDYVSDKYPEQYDHLMAKVIVNDLDTALPIRDIYSKLAALKDDPAAAQLAKQLAAYYNHRFNTSRKVPEKTVDPKAKQLEEKETQLGQKETQLRNKTINSDAAPHLTRSIESSVDKAAKENGFDLAKLRKEQPNRYGRFLKDVRNAVHADVLGDDKWLGRYEQSLKAGDTQKCVRMLNSRHDQAISGTPNKPGVSAKIFQEWFGTGKPKVQPNGDKSAVRAPSGNGQATPLRVNAMPPKAEIAWNHPKTRMIDGEAMRTDGKWVKWRD